RLCRCPPAPISTYSPTSCTTGTMTALDRSSPGVVRPPQPTIRATTAPSASIGQTVNNRGITLTVTEAHAVDSVLMNESNFRPGSGYEIHVDNAEDRRPVRLRD